MRGNRRSNGAPIAMGAGVAWTSEREVRGASEGSSTTGQPEQVVRREMEVLYHEGKNASLKE
jgi:hypothetical protein